MVHPVYHKYIIRQHTRYWRDSVFNGGTHFLILRNDIFKNWTDNKIRNEFQLESWDGGLGQYFCDVGSIVRRKKYIILAQRWGYDI